MIEVVKLRRSLTARKCTLQAVVPPLVKPLLIKQQKNALRRQAASEANAFF